MSVLTVTVFTRMEVDTGMAIARSLSTIPFSELTPTPDALARIPRGIAFRYDVLPLRLHDQRLTLAVPDLGDTGLLDQLRHIVRVPIDAVELPRETIRERLRLLYIAEPTEAAADRRADVPAVRAVDAMFARAIAASASDLHIEPDEDGGRIRVRIDGILRDLEAIPPGLFAPLVSRIKLLAAMDIADKRQPQDGRATISHEGRAIDARVSSVPTIDGEKLVIRLLDGRTQPPELAQLGMPAALLAAYRTLVHAPWGFILVSGPTGSGKTTTLYASLGALDRRTRSVCTVEDPIEMRLAGVTQVQVGPRSGLTFANVLRAFMRQDPNVMMVGEMRDAETAAVAVSASLAGQLVFTTLHANDAPRTIERLTELGVARHALAAGLSGVIAQRLIRRLCDRCRIAAPIPARIRTEYEDAPAVWYGPGACRACDQTGYIGRTGIYELLAIGDAEREAIAAGVSSVQLGAIGTASGYRPMAADGIAKVFAGITSFDELTRVVAWNHAT